MLERTREDDVGLGREDLGDRLEADDDLLEVARVRGRIFEQVVGFTREVVALLDLDDRGKGLSQVRPGRAG